MVVGAAPIMDSRRRQQRRALVQVQGRFSTFVALGGG